MSNARAAGEVTLSRGRRCTFKITGAAPGDSSAVLREYWRLLPVTWRYFTAQPAGCGVGRQSAGQLDEAAHILATRAEAPQRASA